MLTPFPLGEQIKDPWERDTLIIASLQALGRWKSAAVKLVRMVEASPDSWDIITAYVNGQLEMSLQLRRETVQDTSKDSPPVDSSQADNPEGDSPSQDGASPSNEASQEWLVPLIEARDLLGRLAVAELEKFESKEMCIRGPLLGRLELARVVHQAKEDINVALGKWEHLVMFSFFILDRNALQFVI